MSEELTTYIIDQRGFDELKYISDFLSTRKTVKMKEVKKLSSALNSVLERVIYMKVGIIDETFVK
jgi:hypothetical protein